MVYGMDKGMVWYMVWVYHGVVTPHQCNEKQLTKDNELSKDQESKPGVCCCNDSPEEPAPLPLSIAQ